MPQTKDQKKKNIEQIKENIDKQKSIIFVDYQGLKASDLFELRESLKKSGCKMVIAKKTLFNLALKESNKKTGFDIKEIQGQMALIFGLEDEVSPAKISYQFGKKKQELKILGGIFEDKLISPEEAVALAMIPSRQELLAKFVGCLSASVSGFANVLQGNIRNLVYVLSKIKS